MKKIIYLFAAISISLTSCSNDENSSESILVTKITKKYGSDDIQNIFYVYNGNKIVKGTTDSGSVTNYTYEENVITYIENRDKDNNFRRSREYTYSNGKVTTLVDISYGDTSTFSYTYNPNGTVSYTRKRSGSENSTGLLTFVNGNIVKNEVFYGGKYPSTNTYTYEFDTKSNPFKNVLGFNLLLDPDVDAFSPNNMIKDGSAGNNDFDNYIYKYNENGFPSEKQNSRYISETTQYFY